MLGTCGEYVVASTNKTDNIVSLIETQEIGYGQTTVSMCKNSGATFTLKKTAIKRVRIVL
jgi:hypothetical protein